MANPEHLKILEQGVEAWNKWRDENAYEFPDIRDADIGHSDLIGINLYCTDLRNAKLSFTKLIDANLSAANLKDAHFFLANLTRADLSGANLSGANFSAANLSGANLSGALLDGAFLDDVRLTNANLLNVRMENTGIDNVDLSEVKNLESIIHRGPSSIGIDTIYKSRGNIPEKFLRGCGVPEDFITYMRSLTVKAIEFYSCFISYSSKDEEFAKRLYVDLQNEGVRCWFAPEDLKIGDKFRVRIDESIRLYDKLLLVLSENSVSSEWVGDEVEAALEKEDEQKNIVLFPLRLDEAVMEIKTGWPATVRRTRHIGDFSEWKNHDSYKKAFDRLMRDLKAEASR